MGKEKSELEGRKYWKEKAEKLQKENIEQEAEGGGLFDEIDYRKRENKKLKSDLAFERTMLDNVKVEYESLQNVIKELNEDIKKIEENQEYRYHRCMVAERGGEDED